MLDVNDERPQLSAGQCGEGAEAAVTLNAYDRDQERRRGPRPVLGGGGVSGCSNGFPRHQRVTRVALVALQ